MSAKKKGIKPMADEHVNVTPLIDIVMCLIIFFLICGNIAQEETGGDISIPEANLGQELGEMRGRIVVAVSNTKADPNDAVGRVEYMIRGKTIRADDLPATLRAEVQDLPDAKVLVRADRELRYDAISPVLVACAKAKVKSVHFSTQTPE